MIEHNSSVPSVVLKSLNPTELKISEAILAQQNHLHVDLCFVCADSQKIKLHKLVVGCADGFLAQLLGHGFDNNEEATIIFPDVDGDDLITVVSAIYTGFCLVPARKVETLGGIVKMLGLPLEFENPKDEDVQFIPEDPEKEATIVNTDAKKDPAYEIEYVQIEKLDELSSYVKPRSSLLKRNLPCLETTVVYRRSKESNRFDRADVMDVAQPDSCEIEPCNKVIKNLEDSSVPIGCESEQYKLTDFQCIQCEFKSFLKEELAAHKKMAHPAPKHKCDLCSKTFSRKNDLTRHLMLHSEERKYACTFCDSKFIGSGDLHKHVRIHTGEKPYKCEFDSCGKSFTQKGDLNKHVKIHLKIKNHKCHLCGYSCIQGSDLSNHMLTHSNSKPFPCNLCFKSFRRNNQFIHTTMPTYQMTMVMRKMAHPALVQAVKKASEEIYKQGGYIRKMQSLGTRTLPNLKLTKGTTHREGTYLLVDFDVRASDLDKIGDEFRRDKDIIQQFVLSKTEEEFNCAETLDDELKPPAERPSIQTLIEQGRRPPRFKKIFDPKTGLDYYPFHR